MKDDQGWLRVIMWGLIPLLGLVFTAGGGWYLLSNVDQRVITVEAAQRATERVGLERRVDALEAAAVERDKRLRNMELDVKAICVATRARCGSDRE